MDVVNILAPVILLVGLGAVLRASGFAGEDFFRGTNQLVFWIGLPCLLFQKTATAEPQIGAAAGILATLVAGMAASVLAGFLVGRKLSLAPPSLAVFVQGAYRGNLAYVGLPVVLYALAAAGQDTVELQGRALLAIVPLIPAYNILAVLLLVGAQHRPTAWGRQGTRLLFSAGTNPLVIACVAGVAYAYTGLALPLALDRSLVAVGQMALPLALLGIGASLRLWALRQGGLTALAASTIKIVVSPLAGYACARLLGLPAVELQISLLYLAMPTAVMSYVMADRMGGDGRLAGSIVVMSTLLALPALTVVLLATG